MHYNVVGSDRKKLAVAIGEILNQPVVYAGVPTYGYKVSGYTIDRQGTMFFPADAKISEVRHLTAILKERGYTADDEDYEKIPEATELENGGKLTLEMPRADFTDEVIGNLRKIVAGKESLIKKALGADSLPIEVGEHTLQFPWFTLTGADGEAHAYSLFISALCEMAKSLKRVTVREREVENEKFTMRLFLIRLGFVGNEYKTARKILLRNLTGNSAFKNGNAP